MTFGEKLALLRKQHHHTQEQLAELLGVSRQSVSKWESDITYPETEKLLRIGKLYGCSMDALFGLMESRADAEDTPSCSVAAPQASFSMPARGRGLRIGGAVCFWLILATEILRTVAVDVDAQLILRMIFLSAASLLVILWMIRGTAPWLIALAATVLALSATQLVWGFWSDCYLLEYEVEKVYSMGEFEFAGTYTYTRTRFGWGYVLPYLLETLACALWFVFSLWTVLPTKQTISARLWFLPACGELLSLLFGVLIESDLGAKETWLGGFRYYSEISVAECVLFIVFLALVCRAGQRALRADIRSDFA